MEETSVGMKWFVVAAHSSGSSIEQNTTGENPQEFESKYRTVIIGDTVGIYVG